MHIENVWILIEPIMMGDTLDEVTDTAIANLSTVTRTPVFDVFDGFAKEA